MARKEHAQGAARLAWKEVGIREPQCGNACMSYTRGFAAWLKEALLYLRPAHMLNAKRSRVSYHEASCTAYSPSMRHSRIPVCTGSPPLL
jgi:hypothetical protein